jgi:YVTN family beta-propeller protein
VAQAVSPVQEEEQLRIENPRFGSGSAPAWPQGRYNELLLTRRLFLLAPAAALLECGRRRSPGFDGYAFIANAEGPAVAVVDLNTFTLARHVRLDAAPTAIVSPPGQPSLYALTPATGSLHEIGAADLALHRRLQVARTVLSMRLAPDGSSIWLLCAQPRQLVCVGLNPLRVETRVALPLDPFDFDLAPDGKSAVVSFGESGEFGLVDLAQRACRVFGLQRKPSLARFRSDGGIVLIAGAEEAVLSIADAHSGRILVHLPLAVRARHMCFKKDGGQLFITGEGMDALVIVNPYATEVSETALVGHAPGFMAECETADADYLFIANPSSGEVTILDIEVRRVIAVVAVGRGPGFVTSTPDGEYALVLNEDSGDMAVIRLAAIAAKRDRSAPLFTMVPVGSKPVGAAIRHA